MTEYIKRQDSLNTGREKINQALTDANENASDALGKSNHAVNTSNNAINVANQSNQKSDDTQQQLDDIILNDGTGNAEVIQARGGEPLLKDRLNKTETKLDKNDKRIKKNAEYPIPIKTYDGSGQVVHPDVLYFEKKWNNYKYWMVYTPYPYGDETKENPSISCSNDGISWTTPPGLINPLSQPRELELAQKTHLSDGVIFMVGDTMECWWRYRNRELGIERYMRRTTTDGVNWTDEEVTYTFGLDTTINWGLSPTIIYEDGKYNMWFVSGGQDIYYTTSVNGKTNWSTPMLVKVNWQSDQEEFKSWHIEVTKHNSIYNLIINTFPKNPEIHNRNIAWATSTNGLEFVNCKIILEPSIGGFDNQSLYRASLVCLTNNKYRMYYSAYNHTNRWCIGVVEGKSVDTMVGVLPINQDGDLLIDKTSINQITTNLIKLGHTSRLTKEEILFHTPGLKSVKLVNTNTQRIELQTENGEINKGEFYAQLLESLFLLVGSIKPRSNQGITLEGTINMIKDLANNKDPYLKITIPGFAGAGIKIDSQDTLTIVKDNGSHGGHMRVGTTIFDGNSKGVAGEIRYSAGIKKHQGFDGTTWHDLY